MRRRQRAQARWPASERRERKRTVLRASHIRRSRSCCWLRLNHTHMASPAAVSAVERGPSNTPRCGTFYWLRYRLGRTSRCTHRTTGSSATRGEPTAARAAAATGGNAAAIFGSGDSGAEEVQMGRLTPHRCVVAPSDAAQLTRPAPPQLREDVEMSDERFFV